MNARDTQKRAFLLARAGDLPHSRESLMRHLESTHGLLRAWSARQAICDAGLFHSAYGTEAFVSAIAEEDDRAAVQGLIGHEAEGLAWLFGRCSQQSIVDSAESGGPLIDRVEGTALTVTDAQRRDLCELAAANWLEQRPRLDAETQRLLLGAVRAIRAWISPKARTALALASASEADDQALRRWTSNSHRVITISFGGASVALPTFEPDCVLSHPGAFRVLIAIADGLRKSCWDNAGGAHPATRLALREPVSMSELVEWLGKPAVEALSSVGALNRHDPASGRASLAVGLVAMGDEIVVVPGDGKRLDGVYFGIEPLLLDMLGRAVAPTASRVLECGAGSGLAATLAARRATSIASDVLHRATAFVNLTRALNPHLHERLQAVTADGANGFCPSSFDLIMANPPLVPQIAGVEQPLYSHGGPTGMELPIRLLRETLPLLAPDGCIAMVTLDSTLHDGHRPLAEALGGLDKGYCWMQWTSPWRYLSPNSMPRLLANHRAVLAASAHVGIVVIRIGSDGLSAARDRLDAATAALAGSGWILR